MASFVPSIRQTNRILIVVLLLLFASPARAADDTERSLKGPTMAFVIGAAADWTSTAAFLRQGGHEANPVIAWAQQRPTTMIGLGAGIDLGELLAIRYAAARWHRHRAAILTLYGCAILRGAIAYRNIRIMDNVAAMNAARVRSPIRR